MSQGQTACTLSLHVRPSQEGGQKRPITTLLVFASVTIKPELSKQEYHYPNSWLYFFFKFYIVI